MKLHGVVGLTLGALLLAMAPEARAGGAGDPSQAAGDETSADIAGELLVDFRDDVETSVISDVLGRLAVGFAPTALEAVTRVELVRVSPARMDEVRAALSADPRVEVVEPNARVSVLFQPDDPLLREQWHMTRVGVERAWDFSTGRGVTVAVVDTGIACEKFGPYTKATDLGETRCVEGHNFVARSSHANDDHGHGTHVAGTIAQSTNNGLGAAGIAFDARLMPVKVLSAGGWGSTSDVADGIRWAADHGADVINLSLGGPRSSRIMQKAIDHARERGVVVVAAAGNTGGRVQYPGGSENVIGVSALDREDRLAWFSSRGPGVDIAAPGVGVVQQTICDGGHNQCEVFPSFNGTSMASPHVAGAAALLVSLGVTEPKAVEKALLASARPLGSRSEFGAGALDASGAAKRVVLTQVLYRLFGLALALFLLSRWTRRVEPRPSPWRPSFLVPALFTSTGLFFFAPLFSARENDLVDLLARPFGDWDLLVSAGVHGFLPLANVAWPFALTLVFFGVRRARPMLAGFATGTAGYLAAVVIGGGVHSPMGQLGLTVFALSNAAVCLGLAKIILRERAS